MICCKSFFKEISIILFQDFKQSVKNWKIILIILLYLAALFGSLMLVDKVEAELNKQEVKDSKQLYDSYGAGVQEFEETEFENHNLLLEAQDKYGSLHVLVPLIIGFVILPFIILFVGFDIVSADRFTNSLRHLVSRINRLPIIIGKFISLNLVLFFTTIIFYIISNLYLKFKLDLVIPVKELIHPFVFLILYSAALLSIVTLASTLTKKPFSSLALGVLFLIVSIWILSFDKISFLSVFANFKILFNESLNVKLLNLLRLFLISIVCFAVACFKFERMDV
ncbi:MAG: ABC transporter permease subunit [Nanoarchaeota archaeon]|nr:ABC transporter permease [Nanoarchaeota archaeon]MBU1029952.1 ABC transporter permease [Nanoarchaeota archaeon]MBU1849617.1 ABC transporter permease [Nanoarchaeota archaeon]